MRAVIQRVQHASVRVDDRLVGAIEHGFLILLGVVAGDDEQAADKLWRKIAALRIFRDADGKTNLNLQQVGGNVLIVSQFTLAADCKKGNRPSFVQAAPPAEGERLYEYFYEQARLEYPAAAHGEFGADMKVELLNDGPFTIVLDTAQL